jgi:hypothetical protein
MIVRVYDAPGIVVDFAVWSCGDIIRRAIAMRLRGGPRFWAPRIATEAVMMFGLVREVNRQFASRTRSSDKMFFFWIAGHHQSLLRNDPIRERCTRRETSMIVTCQAGVQGSLTVLIVVVVIHVLRRLRVAG